MTVVGAQPVPSPGADVAGVSPVPVQMFVAVSPVLAQMWAGGAQSRRRCATGEPSRGADVAGLSPRPLQMQMSTGAPRPRADVAAVRNRLLTTRIPCDSQRSCAPWVAAWGPSVLEATAAPQRMGVARVRCGTARVRFARHGTGALRTWGRTWDCSGFMPRCWAIASFSSSRWNRTGTCATCNTQHVTCNM